MNVLIIGSYRDGHDRLLDAGHQVSLLMAKHKVLPHDVEKKYSNIILYDRAIGQQTLLKMVSQLHEVNRFEAVISFNDDDHPLAVMISEEIQTFCLNKENPLLHFSDKYRMRELIARHPIASCQYVISPTFTDLLAAREKVDFPFIVKPVDGVGSEHITKIDSQSAFEAFYQQVAPQSPYPLLLEAFIEGPEYSIETLTEAGNHKVVAITRKMKHPVTFIESGHVVPAALSQAKAEQIKTYVLQILNTLAIRNGPAHTEIIYSDIGPILVESQLRTGGDMIVDLVFHTTGIDLYDCVARQSLGQSIINEIPDEITFHCTATVRFALHDTSETMVLTQVNSDDNNAVTSGIRRLYVLKSLPCLGGPVCKSSDRTAAVVVTADDEETALARADEFLESLAFVYHCRAS